MKAYFQSSAFNTCFPAYSRFQVFKISSCDIDFYEETVYSILFLWSWIATINKKIKLVFPKSLLKVEEENKNVPMLFQWLGRTAFILMADIHSPSPSP